MSDSEESAGRRLIADSVAERIERRILDGTLRPGDRLPPERELALELHVNRSSIREALKKLEQLRLVEIQQGSGIRVRSLDEANLDLVMRLLFRNGRPNMDWIRDLLELREVLFTGLIKLGLERASERELTAFVERLREAGDPATDGDRFIGLILELQDLGANMTHNQVVVLLWNSLRRFMEQVPFNAARRHIATGRRDLLPIFRRLAHAAEARDVESTGRAVRDVLRRVERMLLEAFEVMIAAGWKEPAPPRG